MSVLKLLEKEEYLGDIGLASEFLDYVDQRAGLLVGLGGGEGDQKPSAYMFPHRTFQEYLAATHLQTEENVDTILRDHLQDDLAWWREVFLLTAGSVRKTPRMVHDLVDTLIPEDAGDDNVQTATMALARLAAQALEETGFAQYADREQTHQPGRFTRVYRRIQSWLLAGISASEALPAIERAVAGVSLAKLGDPRPEVMTVEGIRFCYVPAGPFWMGSDDDDEMARDSEKPQHEISLNDYWIGQYPVTNAQFGAFVQAGGYREALYWKEAKKAGVWRYGKVKGRFDDEPRIGPARYREPFGLPNHPVVGVNWYEALAFARWLTEQMESAGRLPEGWIVTLPSEAEWEKAARGGLYVPTMPVTDTIVRPGVGLVTKENDLPKRRFPWGDEADPNAANCDDTGIGTTSAMGCFPGGESLYGCQEMSGDVFEWTRDLWSDESTSRVLRGGAFYANEIYARCAARYGVGPDRDLDLIGLRLSVSPIDFDL